MLQPGQKGIYKLGAAAALTGARCHVLEGAVPPLAADASARPAVYGWVDRGLPRPSTGGVYVVEAMEKGGLRVLAYIDRFGRAFSADAPSATPPAQQPDLAFEKLPGQDSSSEELGSVLVRAEDGSIREVARYTRERNRFALLDSWYDFGPYRAALSYRDAMARAFLAFVYRPSLGAPAIPKSGLAGVHDRLRAGKPVSSLRAIVDDVRRTEEDPAFRPPRLVRCLARWLREAGVEELERLDVKDDALRLVRTVRYANTYYLGVEEAGAGVPTRTVWALEAALNRFLLVEEALGENATTASDADCARWDERVLERVGLQSPGAGDLADAPEGQGRGEWEGRCLIAGMLERLRLPVRVDATTRLDAAIGAAAFELKVPDGSLMPATTWREGGGWETVGEEVREGLSRRYALHLSLALVAASFDAAPGIRRIDLVARPLAAHAGAGAGEGEFFPEEERPAYVQASFDRASYEAQGRFERARAEDPLPAFASCGARFDLAEADAFSFISGLASAPLRQQRPEAADGPLPPFAHAALGAENCADMRIVFDGALRGMAERLADRIVRASSATEAIRLVRGAQGEARAKGEDRAVGACTRLMAALAEGALDMGDQNAVVGKFLGEDRCLVALGRARTLAQRDPGAAVDVLVDAVKAAAALDGFEDGAATVHRAFDSYAARMLYNLARAGGPAPKRAAEDRGRRVALVPDSYFLCLLEITRLLEHSFERTDEALRFGQLAVKVAPATAAGYRQLGRAYMLVGDMENAGAILQEGLLVAVQPSDIAMAYYQLAYVLWKAGRPQAGAACYLKSLMTSSAAAFQATAELHELMEEGALALPERSKVDQELAAHAVPVAPGSEVVDALGFGAAAATDAGLFPVARNLLALRMHYRPDDALVNVLRSLGE